MRQSPQCNEHYACACYTNEITRLEARLTEVEAELRKLRRIARMPRKVEGSKHKGDSKERHSEQMPATGSHRFDFVYRGGTLTTGDSRFPTRWSEPASRAAWSGNGEPRARVATVEASIVVDDD